MSARKTKTPVAAAKHIVRGFDLTTVEGSTAFEKDYKRRRAIAEDFYRAEFAELEQHLDDMDGLIMSVMAALAEDRDYDATLVDLARIARLSFLVRLATTLPAKAEEAVTS